MGLWRSDNVQAHAPLVCYCRDYVASCQKRSWTLLAKTIRTTSDDSCRPPILKIIYLFFKKKRLTLLLLRLLSVLCTTPSITYQSIVIVTLTSHPIRNAPFPHNSQMQKSYANMRTRTWAVTGTLKDLYPVRGSCHFPGLTQYDVEEGYFLPCRIIIA